MKKKILVVDDDSTSRTVLHDMLSHSGYEVLEAEHGQAALEQLSAGHVDLILTDRAMPIMDGMALLKALQERQSKVPAVMISAYGEDKLWGQALGYGAEDYLLKPFKIEEVLKLVKRCLKKSKTT